ncbi:MAG: hypothetical protein E6Q76_06400 [Rhizobium sp.]|nr:MAG: hypothetical protein E6Q76_06400 [Rhizobium sp.]
MTDDVIERATIRVAAITPKTRWIFVELALRSGAVGLGEATAQNREDAVVEAFRSVTGSGVVGLSPQTLIARLRQANLGDLPMSSAVSALDQASWDLVGKASGRSVASALGTEHRRTIRAYANINRRTLDRSREGFAQSAAQAIAAGHEAIKIAPFDEATPDARREGKLATAVQPGLARMRVVREVIGPGRRLMIDCHWRFDVPVAEYVIDAAAEVGLYWVECPLPETAENIAAIRSLRDHANRRGVKLAGCEEMTRLDGFLPFLKSGAYDVLMPDVKYAGGLEDMLTIAAYAAKAGIAISPHNPSGPISHAASLQICAAMEQEDFLETQFDETDLFGRLQAPLLPVAQSGSIALPDGSGLGLALDAATLGQTQTFEWTTTAA